MRLLHVQTVLDREEGIQGAGPQAKIFKEHHDGSAEYVIVSHRWEDEVNYKEMAAFMGMDDRCRSNVRRRTGSGFGLIHVALTSGAALNSTTSKTPAFLVDKTSASFTKPTVGQSGSRGAGRSKNSSLRNKSNSSTRTGLPSVARRNLKKPWRE